MTQKMSDTPEIEVLDQDGQVVTVISTASPEWSFDQYTRNRESDGWTWRQKGED